MPFKSPHTVGCAAVAAALTACGGGGGGSGESAAAASYVAPAAVQFPVSANDAVWDEQRQVLYLSIPSAAGPNGNVIVALNPRTNVVVRSQFAGSEPSELALSDDGQYLYAGINGSGSVQRFRLPDLVPDLNIPLDLDDFSGPQHAVDLQVMPGAARSVVVAQGFFNPLETTSRTSLYDDAVARPLSLSAQECTCGSLQWGGSAGRLYAANTQTTSFDFCEIEVGASGLRVANMLSNLFTNFYAQIHYSATSRLLYSDDGTVFDPVAARRVGVVDARGAMVPDPSRNRLYFSTSVGSLAISAFDSATLLPVGVQRPFAELKGRPSRLVRWGSDGLALVARGGSVHLFGGAGTASFDTVVPQGSVVQTLIRGTFNRLAWDSVGGRLYATVSGTSSASPNSILVIDPATGKVVATKPISNEPNALAVSDDGRFLYVGLDGAGTVQRLRLPGLELDVTLSLGSDLYDRPYVAGNMKARPGAAHTLAVSRLSVGIYPPETGGLQVFDDAVPRPVGAPAVDLWTAMHYYNDVDWNGAGTQLFSSSAYGELHILNVDADGVRHLRTMNATFGALGHLHVDRADGLIYHDTGRVVDPASGRPSGTYVTGLGDFYVASDAASNRVFALTGSDGSGARIDLYDKARFTRQRTYAISYERGRPSRLILAGPQHLAFVATEGLYVVRLDPT